MDAQSLASPPRSRRRRLAALLVVVAASAAGFGAGRATAPPQEPPQVAGLLWPAAPKLQPFSLQEAAGQAFTEAAMAGRWTLLFFGFTHCPDICPTTLATMKQAYATLRDTPGLARRLQVVFVSVDAERDTPAVLARYVKYFNTEFRGVTAPMEQLHFLTRQLGADFARVKTGEAGDYWFDHSAAIFLIAPDQQVVAAFDPPFTAQDLAARVRLVYNFLD